MCGPASTAAPACRGAQDADGNPVVSPTTVDYTGIKLGDVARIESLTDAAEADVSELEKATRKLQEEETKVNGPDGQQQQA